MEQRTTYSGPDWDFSIVTPLHPYWRKSEPDPSWRFTDKAGHVHSYGPEFTTPTLAWHKVMTADEDGEEWDAGYYRCRKCKEQVRPGTRTPMGPEYERGPKYAEGRAVVVTADPFRFVCAAEPFSISELLPGLGVSGRCWILDSQADYVRGEARCFVHFRSTGKVEYDEERLKEASGKPFTSLQLQPARH